jgi:hypothetical protein
MKDKIWEVEYEGHVIRAINKLSLFPPKTSEVLEIDDEVIEHKIDGGFFRAVATMNCVHELNGIERQIEIRFAPKEYIPNTGCQILVDGVKVGGDKSIRYVDLSEAKKLYAKGFFHFLLIKNMPKIILSLGIAVLLLRLIKLDTNILMMAYIGGLVGVTMLYGQWKSIKIKANLALEKDESTETGCHPK